MYSGGPILRADTMGAARQDSPQTHRAPTGAGFPGSPNAANRSVITTAWFWSAARAVSPRRSLRPRRATSSGSGSPPRSAARTPERPALRLVLLHLVLSGDLVRRVNLDHEVADVVRA